MLQFTDILAYGPYGTWTYGYVVGADVLGGPPAFQMTFSFARRAEDVAPYH